MQHDETNLPLSDRQKQIVSYLLTAASEKQIALELGISFHTVHTHVRSIYRLLGVTSRAELMAREIKRVQAGGDLARSHAEQHLAPAM